jgi:hypothetical protein
MRSPLFRNETSTTCGSVSFGVSANTWVVDKTDTIPDNRSNAPLPNTVVPKGITSFIQFCMMRCKAFADAPQRGEQIQLSLEGNKLLPARWTRLVFEGE